MLNVQRLTISLPDYLYQLLTSHVENGKVSQFVTGILERELIAKKTLNPVSEFFELRGRLPKKSCRQIRLAIKKGRQ